jgi:hypothetical protein
LPAIGRLEKPSPSYKKARPESRRLVVAVGIVSDCRKGLAPAWLTALSGETPITAAPAAANLAPKPLKAMASAVQPEVSSLG